MLEQSVLNDRIGQLILEVNDGSDDARQELLRTTSDRLLTLTKNMKRSYPSVGRWEQTDDVFQNAMIRLNDALQKLELNDVRHFLRLAALQIRRELIDLYRKHQSRNRLHQTQRASGESAEAGHDPSQGVETTNDPNRLASWSQFHEVIEKMEDREKEIVELLWYHGLSQTAAATVMDLSIKQVRTIWRSARLHLFDAMGGDAPDLGS